MPFLEPEYLLNMAGPMFVGIEIYWKILGM